MVIAKIVSISRKIAASIFRQTVQISNKKNLNFWDKNCFGFCITGLLAEHAEWHDNNVDVKEVRSYDRLADEHGDFMFGGLTKKGISQSLTFVWDTTTPEPDFKTLCTIKSPQGGYLFALADRKTDQNHTLAVKFRSGQWLFMDPTAKQDGEDKKYASYLHGTLSDSGDTVLRDTEMSIFNFITKRYPNVTTIGIIAISKNDD